ncbi:hypothetical protein Nepgr_007350 [Nepenthes gracilis]|uniref:Uncharacterized protein n=1 Tax=Nepenthes gracilis TaxID=150966 RepID=A0AAD3S6Y4_NEPGR|nr:hypothetical protein Nepgr_007350 [Nepenthes gracilis]
MVSVHDSLQHSLSSCHLPQGELSQNPADSIPPMCLGNEQLLRSIKSSSILNMLDSDFCACADGSGPKSSVCESASSGSRVTNIQAPIIDTINDTHFASQKVLAQSSTVGSPMFWTNGYL